LTNNNIEKKLFLKVNREKTQVAYIGKVKYLGYGFYVYKGEGRLKVHPKSIRKLKDKIRGITGRSNGMSIIERKSLCPNVSYCFCWAAIVIFLRLVIQSIYSGN